MLPAQHRLRRRAEFTRAVRAGRRAGSPLLVAHLLLGDRSVPASVDGVAGVPATKGPPRVGLVVSRAVGTAVMRNLVKRRLRALLAARLYRLPDGTLLVVRANPPAAHASSSELAAALDRVLGRLLPAPTPAS